MNYGGNIRNGRTNSFTNNQLTSSSMAQNGIAQKEHERNFDWTLDNILNYTNTIGEKHKIDLTFLYSRESREEDLTQGRANDFVSQALGFNALGLGAVQESFSRREAQNSLSQMGRLNYVFDSKYAFTYTARRDGFSAFSENNKYAIFQAGAFAWTASNEAFLEDSKWLNYLKLRLSFGENGNQGINRFSSLSKINTSQYLFGDGGSSVSTLNIETMANSELSWESTASTNIGLDFQILDNKISGSFDAYLSNTKDLLQLRSIPTITGFEQVLTNIGEVENKGFEFSINSSNYDTPNFGWDTNVVFSSSKNKIISLGGVDANEDGIEDDDIANGWFIGQPIDAVFGFKTDGIYQLNDTDILSGFGPGDFRIVDTNNDGTITPDDRQILGRTSPNYIISLGNTIRHKGFSLYILINSIQGGGKNNAYIGDNYTSRSVSPRSFSTYVERFNIHNVPYWTPSNPTNLYPRLDYDAPFDHPIIEDRSFVRIQDISLSYNFNEKVLNKIGFTSLQLFTSIKNAHTFTNWTGYNPETSTSVKGSPTLSSYTFGLNFGF
jgi:TonB-linked SusC/RagA family outer membrane protein